MKLLAARKRVRLFVDVFLASFFFISALAFLGFLFSPLGALGDTLLIPGIWIGSRVLEHAPAAFVRTTSFFNIAFLSSLCYALLGLLVQWFAYFVRK